MKNLINTLLQTVLLEAQLTNKEPSQDMIQQLKIWNAGIFRLVVMGEIKKGKSSFINALLGAKDLVPVSSNVATSTIFKIRYAKEQGYVVHFEPQLNRLPLNISACDINQYGTEDGNPNNQEGVAFIEVMYPSPLLKAGIVIIDTPGLGGLFKQHKKITWEYVPKADAVFFVSDSVESPIGQLELEYIDAIHKITPYLYFAQTKTKAVDGEAREARRVNNLNILAQATGKDPKSIPYFLLDAQLRFEAEEYKDIDDLNDSGYPSLLAFINNVLLPNKQSMLIKNALQFCEPVLLHVEEIVQSKKLILGSESKEKLDQLSKQIKAKQKELNDWQSKKQSNLLMKVQQGLQEIRLEAMQKLQACCPNGDMHAELEARIYKSKNIEELQAALTETHDKLPECMGTSFYRITETLKDNTKHLMKSITESDEMVSLASLMLVNQHHQLRVESGAALERVSTQIGESHTFNDLRTTVYGGVAGMTIAGVAGGVIGSVIPVIGTITGSIAGGILATLWGGGAAYSCQKDQELKAAKAQSCQALAQVVSSIYTKAQSEFERVVMQINNTISQNIRDFVAQKQDDIKQQIDELNERSKMGQQELVAAKQDLAKLEAQVQSINKTIQLSIKS